MRLCRLLPILGFGLSTLTLSAAPVVDEITSLQASPSFTERHHALHKLRAGELEAAATQLIEFMRAQEVPQAMHPVDYMSLVNDIINLLLAHDLRAEELLLLILEVIPDDSADEVWRDYAVQKLGYTLDRGDISEETRDAGFAMLERAVKGEFPRVQGTALMASLKLSTSFATTYPFLEKESLGEVALGTARDSDALLMERVTAIQVAALCGESEALSFLRATISPEKSVVQEPMLLVSAIAALGYLGTENELTALRQYRLSHDVRVRAAARNSIKKIESKF